MDPVMSTLMEDPVRLPTSGTIMDRAHVSVALLHAKCAAIRSGAQGSAVVEVWPVRPVGRCCHSTLHSALLWSWDLGDHLCWC